MTVIKPNRVTTSVAMIVSLVVRRFTTAGVYLSLFFSVSFSLLTSHCTLKHQVIRPASITAANRIWPMISPITAIFSFSTELQQRAV